VSTPGRFGSTTPTARSVNGYNVYTALMTQSLVADPVATVLANGIGAIVWTRAGVGDYRGTLTGAFLDAKTFVLITGGVSTKNYTAARATDNFVVVRVTDTTGEAAEYNSSAPMSIQIQVYP
jgi:hypothetical protein